MTLKFVHNATGQSAPLRAIILSVVEDTATNTERKQDVPAIKENKNVIREKEKV